MNMDPAEQLQAAITQHVGTIHRVASASPPGGGPEWDGLLRHYGLCPLDGSERQMIVSGMHLSRGAVPAEVRIAFVGLQQWASRELERLKMDPSIAARPSMAWVAERIRALVDQETAGYERALGLPPPAPASPAQAAPAAPSLASIFANAQQTSKEVPWANMTYKTTTNLNCVHCGGPQEQPADFMCKYCRRPIAGKISPTA